MPNIEIGKLMGLGFLTYPIAYVETQEEPDDALIIDFGENSVILELDFTFELIEINFAEIILEVNFN